MRQQFLILIGITSFLLSSCNHFLDINPLAENSKDNFYKSESDIDLALNAVYDGVQALQRPSYLDHFSEVRSDNAYDFATTPAGGTYADFDNFSLKTNNTQLNSFWVKAYDAIQRANVVLNRVEGIEGLDDEKRNRIIGQSLFLRSLVYTYLTQIWGDVPLVLDETVDPTTHFSKTRNSRDSVEAQIIDDLKIAENLLPSTYAESVDYGRVTQGAVDGLLARVFLIKKDYNDVVNYADKVIDSHIYELDDSYENFFNPNSDSKEDIFFITFKSGTNSEGFPYEDINHDYNNDASFDLRSTYSADPRLGMNIAPTNINTFYSKKRHNLNVASDNTISIKTVILRYADILLMKAEALSYLNSFPNQESFDLVDQIRNRVSLPPLDPADYSTQEDFEDALLYERRIEFAFEDLRWFDLVRTGKVSRVMSSKEHGGEVSNSASALPFTWNDRFILFPIPQTQIDASGGVLTQNPGY